MWARHGRHRLLKVVATLVAVGILAVALARIPQLLRGPQDGGKAEATTANVLERVDALLDENKTAEALALLSPLVDRDRKNGAGPHVLMALARAERQAGNPEQALNHLRRAARDFPHSPEQPRAALAYARALEEAARHDEAASIYEQVRRNAPPEIRAAALSGLGRRAEARREPLAARELFHQAAEDARWDSPEWQEAVDALGRLNVALIFSKEATPESQVYGVQKGDNLTAISSKLNTTQGLLTRANGIDENTQLVVGQPLKYTPRDFRIRVERSKRRLFLRDKDGIFKVYPVAVGMPGQETALGTYTIGNKEKDQAWHRPGEGLMTPTDPRHEFGTRWMPLVPTREGLPTRLGLHGALDQQAVGGFSSTGMVVLRREDIEELFDLVVRGTPVEIVETCEPASRD